MRIKELIQRRTAEQIAGDWKRAAELILIDPGDDQPELVEELIEVADRLGLDGDDLERAHTVLTTLQSHQQLYEQGSNLYVEIDAAKEATRKSAEAMNKVWAKLQAEHLKLVEAERELKRKRHVASSAVTTIHNLKRENPELLAHVAVPGVLPSN